MLFYIKHIPNLGVDMSEFTDKVNELVSKMEKDKDGKWKLPEDAAKDLSEETMFAVTSERRYRDTQGAYTKSQQNFRQQEAITDSLQERLLKSEVTLTKEQVYELNTLKKSDPDAWRSKLNEYEETNKIKLTDELKEIRISSANKGELEVRKEQMALWSKDTGIELTSEIVAHDLPPSFLKELDSGKVTFEEFLEKAGKFLKANKVVQGSTESIDDNTLDLGNIAGGQEPSKKAQEGDFDETYENDTIF